MDEKQTPRKRGEGGRPPKIDPAANRVTVRFTDRQYADFLTMFDQSGVRSKARFILARIFGEAFRVVKTDSSAVDFVTKLSALYGQFRSVGVNYNQVVKELHIHFSEKKALILLYKLEKITAELAGIGQRIIALSEDFRRRWWPEVR